jgi:hypothetical protein
MSNTATDHQISDITDSYSTYTVDPFIAQIRNPLEHFELDDTLLYTGDTTVAQVLENILLEFDPELPLILNILPPGIAESVVEYLDVFGIPVSPINFSVLHCFDPIHRRMDLQSFQFSEGFFSIIDNSLPLDTNECTDVIIEDILHCFDARDDPLLPPLPLRDVEPLSAYEAPDEVEADVDLLVGKLIGMILAVDVVPFIHVLDNILDEEWEIVIGELISESMLIADAAKYATDVLGIQKIVTISGPVADRPVLITAEDIVARLLWDDLLSDLPFRPREIDEIVADELDELDPSDIEPDLYPEEEDLPDELKQMLSYKPKFALRMKE